MSLNFTCDFSCGLFHKLRDECTLSCDSIVRQCEEVYPSISNVSAAFFPACESYCCSPTDTLAVAFFAMLGVVMVLVAVFATLMYQRCSRKRRAEYLMSRHPQWRPTTRDAFHEGSELRSAHNVDEDALQQLPSFRRRGTAYDGEISLGFDADDDFVLMEADRGEGVSIAGSHMSRRVSHRGDVEMAVRERIQDWDRSQQLTPVSDQPQIVDGATGTYEAQGYLDHKGRLSLPSPADSMLAGTVPPGAGRPSSRGEQRNPQRPASREASYQPQQRVSGTPDTLYQHLQPPTTPYLGVGRSPRQPSFGPSTKEIPRSRQNTTSISFDLFQSDVDITGMDNVALQATPSTGNLEASLPPPTHRGSTHNARFGPVPAPPDQQLPTAAGGGGTYDLALGGRAVEGLAERAESSVRRPSTLLPPPPSLAVVHARDPASSFSSGLFSTQPRSIPPPPPQMFGAPLGASRRQSSFRRNSDAAPTVPGSDSAAAGVGATAGRLTTQSSNDYLWDVDFDTDAFR